MKKLLIVTLLLVSQLSFASNNEDQCLNRCMRSNTIKGAVSGVFIGVASLLLIDGISSQSVNNTIIGTCFVCIGCLGVCDGYLEEARGNNLIVHNDQALSPLRNSVHNSYSGNV